MKSRPLDILLYAAPAGLFLSYVFWIGFFLKFGFEFIGLVGLPDQLVSMTILIVPLAILYGSFTQLVNDLWDERFLQNIVDIRISKALIVFLAVSFSAIVLLIWLNGASESTLFVNFILFLMLLSFCLAEFLRAIIHWRGVKIFAYKKLIGAFLFLIGATFQIGSWFAVYRSARANEVTILRTDARIEGAKVLLATEKGILIQVAERLIFIKSDDIKEVSRREK